MSVDSILVWANDYRASLILAGLVATIAVAIWATRRAIRSGRPDTWLSRVALLAGFGWSAEGMWEVATQTLHLSTGFAIGVFTFFEIQLLTSMLRAERAQKLFNHPGRHGTSAWMTALVAGGIAATAGDSTAEMLLRLAVPLMVTNQWWVGMTGDGVTRRVDAITWTLTPRRLLVALRLARPGEQELATVDQRRQELAIARVSHRLHTSQSTKKRARFQRRLHKLAMHADDATLDAARQHLERTWQAADRTRPATVEELEFVAAAREAQQTAELRAQQDRNLLAVAEEVQAELHHKVEELQAELQDTTARLRAELHAQRDRNVPQTNPDHASEGLHIEGSRTRKPAAKFTRRTLEETVELFKNHHAQNPGISKEEMATKLRITTRRLHDVMKETGLTLGIEAEVPAPVFAVNGSHVPADV